MDKNQIRKSMLKKRAALTQEEIQQAGAKMAKTLMASPLFKEANTIMLYMDYRKEAPTKPLIDAVISSGKQLILPLTDGDFNIIPFEMPASYTDYLQLSAMGIPEPDPSRCPSANLPDIDLVIIPGVVFDSSGNRIGFGKGCYDKFLPTLRPDVSKVALCYDFQIMDTPIPPEPWDINMDYLLTESGLIKVK